MIKEIAKVYKCFYHWHTLLKNRSYSHQPSRLPLLEGMVKMVKVAHAFITFTYSITNNFIALITCINHMVFTSPGGEVQEMANI